MSNVINHPRQMELNITIGKILGTSLAEITKVSKEYDISEEVLMKQFRDSLNLMITEKERKRGVK